MREFTRKKIGSIFVAAIDKIRSLTSFSGISFLSQDSAGIVIFCWSQNDDLRPLFHILCVIFQSL